MPEPLTWLASPGPRECIYLMESSHHALTCLKSSAVWNVKNPRNSLRLHACSVTKFSIGVDVGWLAALLHSALCSSLFLFFLYGSRFPNLSWSASSRRATHFRLSIRLAVLISRDTPQQVSQIQHIFLYFPVFMKLITTYRLNIRSISFLLFNLHFWYSDCCKLLFKYA